jgi:hypothetical protein
MMAFAARFLVDNILPNIVAANLTCDFYRRLVVHMDDTSPHRGLSTAQNLEENGIVGSSHPAFSPDHAPSGFFLFGALKGQLADRTSGSADELVNETCEMMSSITRAKLETSFLEGEERLQRYIDINDADVD